MVHWIRRILRRTFRLPAPLIDQGAIRRYIAHGRKPWSPGYHSYQAQFLMQVFGDPALMNHFRAGDPLPEGYGPALDERVVEYPWTLSQLADCGPQILDAGSTLNRPYVLDHPEVAKRNLVLLTLAPEPFHLARANVSYLYGDLRGMILADASMDAVVSISTLEHVGMDNTRLYTTDRAFAEASPGDYRKAIEEFRRVLKPGGLALITVPFGKRENHGWQQQFDQAGLEEMIQTFGGKLEEVRFYRYLPSGWVKATAEECAGCEYFNVHARSDFDADRAAAARAVACLRLRK